MLRWRTSSGPNFAARTTFECGTPEAMVLTQQPKQQQAVGGVIMSVFLTGFLGTLSFELSRRAHGLTASYLLVNRIFSAALPLRSQIGKIPTSVLRARPGPKDGHTCAALACVVRARLFDIAFSGENKDK